MNLPVVFRRRFQDDLAAGSDWYEEQRSGTGEEFLSAVQATLKSIELYPEVFVSVHGDVRRAIVSRFPFAIFYLVEPRRVVVLRVLHTAVTPGFGLALGVSRTWVRQTPKAKPPARFFSALLLPSEWRWA